VWADAVSTALLARAESFVLDLRSEAYVALGPVPDAVPSAYVRVVSADADGTVRALNHLNKASKGALVRTLARTRPTIRTVRGLLRWASTSPLTRCRLPGPQLPAHTANRPVRAASAAAAKAAVSSCLTCSQVTSPDRRMASVNPLRLSPGSP
jgi:hypothetical protein